MNKETVFPVDSSSIVMTRGMTLRDYFAAQAMHGMLGNVDLIKSFREGCGLTGSHNERDRAIAFCAALSAYTVADAMLAERKK